MRRERIVSFSRLLQVHQLGQRYQDNLVDRRHLDHLSLRCCHVVQVFLRE